MEKEAQYLREGEEEEGGGGLGALPCGSSPHALSKLIHELIPKVFNASFFI